MISLTWWIVNEFENDSLKLSNPETHVAWLAETIQVAINQPMKRGVENVFKTQLQKEK